MQTPLKSPADAARRCLLASAPALLFSRATAAGVLSALEAYERQCGGRVGVYARNLASGAVLQWRAEERFVMCSTFKASLAACVLARVDRQQDHLDDPVAYGPGDLLEYAPVAREHVARGFLPLGRMCQAVVEISDNTCANLLLDRIGGPPALTAFWRSIGDTVTRLDHNEPEMNRSPPGDPHDTTTPMAMAASLRRLALGDALTTPMREQLLGWMVNCRTGANRLRGGIPATWKVADKTGNNGSDAAGDIALVWPREGAPTVVCAYAQGGTPSDALLASTFAQIGRMVAAL